jgi:general secretion pathway protein E
MFAKKPLPEPKPLGLPPILRIDGLHITLEQPPPPGLSPEPSPEPSQAISEQAPSGHIAQAVIAQAFREGATEITLTPDVESLVVHYLVADEWRHTMTIPAQIAPGLGGAFKGLAGLPVWEHRMALQGLIVVQYGTSDFDVHIAITPTRHGEKIALRMKAV